MISPETRLFAEVLLRSIQNTREIHIWYGAIEDSNKQYSNGAVRCCDDITTSINILIKLASSIY